MFERDSAFQQEEGYKRTAHSRQSIAKYLNEQEIESKTKESGKRALARLDEIIDDLHNEVWDFETQYLTDELEEVRHALSRALSD